MVKDKVRLTISIHPQSLDLIGKFADGLKMSKSEFLEDVAMTFIKDVVTKAQDKRNYPKTTRLGY